MTLKVRVTVVFFGYTPLDLLKLFQRLHDSRSVVEPAAEDTAPGPRRQTSEENWQRQLLNTR